MAKQCADHMVLLDDAAQRLQKEEPWHTETSAQHGASGIKHAVNICKIVEAMGTLSDEWTRVQKLIQNGTSDSAFDELQKNIAAARHRQEKLNKNGKAVECLRFSRQEAAKAKRQLYQKERWQLMKFHIELVSCQLGDGHAKFCALRLMPFASSVRERFVTYVP